MAATGTPPAIILLENVRDRPTQIGRITTHVLASLGTLAARDPYGTRDRHGRDRLRAWTWSYLARSAVRLYQVTGDRRLIDAVLAAYARYEAAARRNDATHGYGWYTRETTGDLRREVPVAGLIIAPIVEMLTAARHSKDLARLIATNRASLLASVERGIAGLEQAYREVQGMGHYVSPLNGAPEPLNLMSVYGAQLIGLAELTGNPRYRNEAAGIARTWQRAMIRGPYGGLSWPYHVHAGAASDRPEPVWKAAVAIELPLAAHRAGLVFTDNDMLALAASLHTTVLEETAPGRFILHSAMAQDSRPLDPAATADRAHALALGAWYAYACHDARVAPMLDRLLPALDPARWTHAHIALAGYTAHLRDAGQSRRCGSVSAAAANR